MRLIKLFSPYFLILIASLYFIYLLYDDYHPFGGIRYHQQTEDIENKAKHLAEELGLEIDGTALNIELNQNRNLIRQLQSERGLPNSAQLLRENIPGYYFDISWIEKKSPVRIDNEDNEVEVRNRPKIFGKKVEIQFDLRGNLIGFNYLLPDSQRVEVVDAEIAKHKALRLIQEYTNFKSLSEDSAGFRTVDHQSTVLPGINSNRNKEDDRNISRVSSGRRDFEFVWFSSLPDLENKIKITTKLAGPIITDLEVDFNVPPRYSRDSINLLHALWEGMSVLFFIIAISIIAVKKIRSYEISFKMAIQIGILVAVSSMFEIFSTISGQPMWEIVLPLIFGPLFLGGAFVILWAVSESLGREIWNEKYLTIDLIAKGYFKQSEIGWGLLRGISFGTLSFTLLLLLTAAADYFFELAIVVKGGNAFNRFSAYFPALNEVAGNFYQAGYILTPYLVLTIPLLKKKIYQNSYLILIGTLLMGMTIQDRIQPFPVGLIITALSAIIIVWVFVKYDILAAFISIFTFLTIDLGASFFFVDKISLKTSGWYLFAGMLLTLCYALYTVLTKDRRIDQSRLRPAFVEHITERERLQKELEIARTVQMDFLPKELPEVHGLNMAARCSPALEVGGDYYDLIKLDEKRLGVVIGDVSGKGTQAAFYMTLTKGFIRALVRGGKSPSEVLKEANTLFYENARRNTFISMVFAVFDLEKKQVTLARAGHNPVIMHTSKEGTLEMVYSEGLALGLDPGINFDKHINDRQLSFENGDVFVFYTDGLTEARNKDDQEFGEERLFRTISSNSAAPAERILKQVFVETKRFANRRKQHDDMTLIIVKIVL